MGGVVLSDVEASMMEQGKAAVAAMTKTTTQPSQHVRAMPGDPTVDERVSFGGAVALIVVAFLNADERFRGTKLLERKRGAPSSGPSIDDHERAWQSHRALKLQHEQLAHPTRRPVIPLPPLSEYTIYFDKNNFSTSVLTPRPAIPLPPLSE
uniref:Uncharacterized protein n=1 Tax=Oryza rufipogon TaxID=4529 RepID=A0A0E0Q4L1_ORYRU